eukprot:6321082-Amphidinium_carterae.1
MERVMFCSPGQLFKGTHFKEAQGMLVVVLGLRGASYTKPTAYSSVSSMDLLLLLHPHRCPHKQQSWKSTNGLFDDF